MRYYALLTDITPGELAGLQADLASGAKHPRQVKEDLAKAMVARYHSQAAADHEAQEFIRVIAKSRDSRRRSRRVHPKPYSKPSCG